MKKAITCLLCMFAVLAIASPVLAHGGRGGGRAVVVVNRGSSGGYYGGGSYYGSSDYGYGGFGGYSYSYSVPVQIQYVPVQVQTVQVQQVYQQPVQVQQTYAQPVQEVILAPATINYLSTVPYAQQIGFLNSFYGTRGSGIHGRYFHGNGRRR